MIPGWVLLVLWLAYTETGRKCAGNLLAAAMLATPFAILVGIIYLLCHYV